MRRGGAAAVTLLMGVMALAGCADDGTVGLEAPAPGSADGLVQSLTSASEVGVPTWVVGQWFGHHVFFGEGGDDAEGVHFNTIVVDDSGGSYLLASDDPDVAVESAIIDYPILGPASKADLSTTGLGMDWKLYDFPLRDNKTWSHRIVLGDFLGGLSGDEIQVTFTSTFAPAIWTPAGDRSGFEIEGVLDNGTRVYRYDYVPDIGWYAHFWMYDYLSPDPDDFIFHVMSMGHGRNWTGTYYLSTAEVAIELFTHVIPPAAPAGVSPAPHGTFTVADGDTYVAGYMFGFAFTGAQTVELIDPDGERHGLEPVTDTGTPATGGGTFDDSFFTLPAKSGEWQVVLVGAGFATVAGVFAWTVVETTGTL